jgi:hypothetical protein
MSIITTREQRRQLERDNAKRPLQLELIPRNEWPEGMATRPGAPIRVLRSRGFLVQCFQAPAPAFIRLSILRTSLQGDRWTDNITWDEIQRLKAEAGFAESWAVEIYPPDADVVNVANIRHVWILDHTPAYGWRKER